MSGYRQHSFDPNAGLEGGRRPLRPYNWVQWAGVALGAVGVVLLALHLLGKAGVIPPWVESSSPSFALLLIGSLLVNSRTESIAAPTPEQQAKNRRTLLLAIAVCAILLVVVAFVEVRGA